MAGGTGPNEPECMGSDGTVSAPRSPVAISVVAGGTDSNESEFTCTGSDGAGSASRFLVAISVVADGTSPNKSECTGSDDANEGVINGKSAVFRGGGLASTSVG